MMLLLFSALANDTFPVVKTTDTCTIRKRDKTATQGAAMWATCTWPDVDPAVLVGMLTDLDRYDQWIWPIEESRVERTDAERLLVYQRQHIFGLSDREVLLWVDVRQTPTSAAIRWSAANDQPLVLQKGAIRTPRNKGFWTVVPNATGPGTTVVHQIEVDAGGLPLPAWLVRAIQTRGFLRLLGDIHDHGVDQAKAK